MSGYIREKLGLYPEAAIVGAGRGLLALPLEHPLDVIKTRAQAAPEIRSTWEIAKKAYQSGGIRGFYSGAIPNGTRLAIKQMYRYPMMLSIPQFFKKTIPVDFQKRHHDIEPIVTALSIASFETFIISPLERCKVFLMTNDAKNKQLREFFQRNQGHLRVELFRGIRAVYVKQIASWASFLVSDNMLFPRDNFKIS
jgi:hypothetical protein